MKVFDIVASTPQGPAARDEQTFLLGLSFHEAAIRSGEEHREPTGKPVVALCPMIVRYAFAAELYLKSLSSRPAKGHRLNVLFDHLDAKIRRAIAVEYTAVTGRTSSDLENDLRTFASAFVDWRYIFEGDGKQLRLNLLIVFVKSSYAVVRSIHPSWSVTLHQDERLRANEVQPSMTVANLGGGTFVHVVDGTGGTLD